ncbi:DNA polymerase lambda isoform X4 [Sardina pilchardus]|uniref:DNA polymerase lambda isoform X4 n=1 Tax=Sardina pilchardus TaxID=27697 RepID=UPI002E13DE37
MEAHGILKAFPKVKRSKIVETKDAPPPKKKPGEIVTGSVFQGVSIHILPAGIGKARCEIFQRQITQNGGKIENALGPGVTHVIVEDTMDCERALRLLKADTLPSSVKLVKCSWLSMCISEKRLLDTTAHCLLLPDSRDTQGNKSKAKEEPVKHNSTKEDVTQQHDFQTVHEDPAHTMTQTQTQTQEGKDNYGDEDGVSQNDLDALMGGHHPTVGPSSPPDTTAATATATAPPPPSLPGKWVCAQSSVAKCNNHNKHLTDKLEPLAKAYTHKGDRWRALGYSKAINALKSYHKPVTSYEEACQIPGIGHKMADKIMEIMESGHLRKLDHMGEDVPVLELFSNIWGVGAKTALLWYQMVREAAHAVDPGLVSVACGSYRRGKATCGDVDVLITHPDGKSHRGIFSKVLHILHESGFLTDDLVSSEDNGEQKKYMGVCRLPGPGQRHRRLDVIVVPHGEFACALLYFTGSAHFNRSMRALAKTKRMSLSEHSLNCNVLRQGAAKVAAGSPLPTHSERDVFTHLGVPYREPHERDW